MVTIKNIEKIMYSSGSEREMLCEAMLGKSFEDAWPELEYELLIGKLSVKEWTVTAIDYSCMCEPEKLSVQLYDRKTGSTWYTDVYKWQVDQRFVDAMSEFASMQLGWPSEFKRSEDVANTSIMKLVKSFVGKE